MMRFILAAMIALGTSSFAFAGELDNDANATNKQQLQGTMVLRVDSRDNSSTYVKTDSVVSTETDAKTLATAASFQPVPAANMKSELDKDGGVSSWYFYNPYYYGGGYYRPSCNWYGNYYSPFYYYTYSYYSYYYYSGYNSCWSFCGY